MDSTDKLEKGEKLSGNETEEQGGEKVNSDSKIDIFAGDEFERSGQEGPEPVSAPEPSSGDESIASGSEVSIVTEDVFEGSGKQETEPVSAPESSSGGGNSVSGSQVNVVTGDVFEGSGKQETKPDPSPERSSENASKEQGGKGTKPESNRGNPPGRRRNYGAKSKFLLVIAIGVSLFLGIGYIYVKPDNLKLNNKKLDIVPERKGFPIPKGESAIFDPFIVPFKNNTRFTYISLSIVISLPNNEVRNEMTRKRDRIRGILYDMFIEEVNRENKIPPIDHLKKSIIRTVNRVLSVGEVKEVFVTQFLAV
jgi:flagellar basal body-associated protein FliL